MKKCYSKSHGKRYLLFCALLLWTDLLIIETVNAKTEGFLLPFFKEKPSLKIIWHINLVGELKETTTNEWGFISHFHPSHTPCFCSCVLLLTSVPAGFPLSGMSTPLSGLCPATKMWRSVKRALRGCGAEGPPALQVPFAAVWDECGCYEMCCSDPSGAP